MSDAIQTVLAELRARAARRCMGIRQAEEAPAGWQLHTPFRVVCHGSLDQLGDWLTAAENNDR